MANLHVKRSRAMRQRRSGGAQYGRD